MNYFDHIGLQLYTLREAFTQSPEDCLRKVAAIGYKEIELHGMHLMPEVQDIIGELGLRVSSSHFLPPYLTGFWSSYGLAEPDVSSFQSQLDLAAKFEVPYLVMPMLLDRERGNIDHYKRLAHLFNKWGEACKKVG
ncbi:MAG: hypothetical protein AAF696_27725, partial [Bacteroidota bacterium]